MSLQRKLLLAFGGLWLVLLAVCLISIGVFSHYSTLLERIFHENYNSVVYCDRMEHSLDALDHLARAALLDGRAAPRKLALRYQAAFNRNLHRELNNVSLPGERTRAIALRTVWVNYMHAYATFASAISPRARQALFRRQLSPLYTRARGLALAISDMNLNNMRTADSRAKVTLLESRNALLVLLLVGSTLATACVAVLARAILDPLLALTRSAKQIAAGNLELTVPVRSRDQIGQLAEAFNSMAQSLRQYRQLDHARLLRTQQTTQLAIDSLSDAVIVTGPDGTVEIVNRSASNRFGVSPGSNASSGPEWLRRLYAQTLESGSLPEPSGYEGAVQLFERGEEKFLLPRAMAMRDAHDRTIGVVAMLVDVTRLRKADEIKSSLVSTVSHELKTPLTTMRLAVHLLAEQTIGPLNDRQVRLVEAAREDTERLYRIIENLLSMSRIESGGRLLTFAGVPLEQIIDQAIQPLREGFQRKGVALEVNIPPECPAVRADVSSAPHIFTNVLSNALKFTPAGGRVAMCVACDEAAATVRITDTGPGIAAEHLPKLFEKFYRVPTEDGPTGAGLGLAIAREIVEAHGGSIGVESSPGRGSCFIVTMPLASPAATDHPTENPSHAQ